MCVRERKRAREREREKERERKKERKREREKVGYIAPAAGGVSKKDSIDDVTYVYA